MAYIFDGPNKRIELSLGTTVLGLSDLYSRYKEWLLTGQTQYALAFETVGGDIPEIPLYLFLINGWRIVPQSADHTLTVQGGILEVQGGGDPFVDPAGSYKIRINRHVPGIAIGYATNNVSGLTAQESNMLMNMPSEILSKTVEGTLTIENILKVVLSALVGKSTGVGTNTETYYAQDNVTPRVTASFDNEGNRLTITLNGV